MQALGYLLGTESPNCTGCIRGSPARWLPGDYAAVFSVKGPNQGRSSAWRLIIDDGEIVSNRFRLRRVA